MEEPILYSGPKSSYDIVHRRDICTAHVPPHIHDTVEIYLNLSVLPNVLLGNQVITAEPGTLILIPPFCVHQLFDRNNELYDRYILSVNTGWLDNIFLQSDIPFEYLKNTGHPLLLPLIPEVSEKLQVSLERLLSLQNRGSFDAMACFFNCMAQIDDIVHAKSGAGTRDKVRVSTTQQSVNNIIRYLNEHSENVVTLRDLSEHFYLNPDYISRIFKKHTHTTVSRYITLQKIARAQLLLQEGYTVTQVQIMTGYSSYAHFSHTFKQQVGISPGAYRSRNITAPRPAQS